MVWVTWLEIDGVHDWDLESDFEYDCYVSENYASHVTSYRNVMSPFRLKSSTAAILTHPLHYAAKREGLPRITAECLGSSALTHSSPTRTQKQNRRVDCKHSHPSQSTIRRVPICLQLQHKQPNLCNTITRACLRRARLTVQRVSIRI